MTTLTPEQQAALDEIATKQAAAATPPAATKIEVKNYKWYDPRKALYFVLRHTLMAAIVILGGIAVSLFAFIAGAGIGQATATAVYSRPSPIKVEFKQGSVEGKGFIGNFLWRNAGKKFEVSSVVTTDYDGTRNLKNTSIQATRENGDMYQLKAGTQDVWVQMERPARPSKDVPTPSALADGKSVK